MTPSSAPTHPAANGASSNGIHSNGTGTNGAHGSPEFGEGIDPLAAGSSAGSIADAVDLWPNGGGYGRPFPTREATGREPASHAPHPPFAGRPAGPARPASVGSVFTARPQTARQQFEESRQRDARFDAQGGAADTWDIREAFLNLAGGRLIDTARNDAARAHAFLTQFGFEQSDIEALGFGLYPEPAEVEEYLRRCGFAEEAVKSSGLTRDRRGDRRTNWTGALVLPIDDENGRCV
ncbi:MAG: hypothetical protein AAF907_07880, partial [Planctomycetota bacterium]